MDSEGRSNWFSAADGSEQAGEPEWHTATTEDLGERRLETQSGNWYGDDWSWRAVGAPEQVDVNGVQSVPPMEDETGKADDGVRWGALLREVAETLILTVLIFVLVRGVLVQNFKIEGFSMEPTLHEGQYLIVNKFIYYLQPPQRGDIIVFAFPRGPERDFIKRVIGLPGDTVEIRSGQVLVNGEPLEEPYISEPVAYSSPPVTLGPNEYFVLGDNRNNSSDSHTWGVLDRKYIIGKAWLSYWPPEEWGFVPNYPVQAREPDTP